MAAVLAALLAAGAYSFFSLRLWEQQSWNEIGSGRFRNVAFAAVLLAASLYPARSRALAAALVGAAFLYTMAAAGAGAALGAMYWLAGAWCLGRLALRALRLHATPSPPAHWILEAAFGLAIVAFAMGATAWLPIHRSWLHLAWPGLCLSAEARSLPALWRWLRSLPWRQPCSTASYIVAVLLAFVLFAHWQAALMPEMSADGLAMHLTIAKWMAAYGSFHFDVTRAAWAVSPMAGDWLYASSYLVGGEAAARLVNLACLLLLAALTYSLVARWTQPVLALLATALFVSSPVAYLVTGSLFVENSWTLWLLAAVLAVERWRETERSAWLAVAGALAGCSVAGKFGALFCLLALMAAWTLALRGQKRLRGGKLLAVAAFLLFACPPYLQALVRTGNPVFPYFNTVFHSPLIDDKEPFRDARWGPYLRPDLLYRMTFQSSRFMETMDGTAGFQWFVLWPAAFLALRRRLPFWVLVAALSAPLIIVVVFSGIAYLRYIYPAYLLGAVFLGWAMGEARQWNRWLGAALTVAALLCAAVNAWFMGASGWNNKDFALNPLVDPAETGKLIEAGAPQRKIIDYFNANAPGQPVAFLEDSVTAGFLARAYTNSWHTLDFALMLKRVQSPAELRKELDRRGIRYLVVRVESGEYRSNFVPVSELARQCGEEVITVSSLVGLRLKDGCPPAASEARRPQAAPPAPLQAQAPVQAETAAAPPRAELPPVVDDFDQRIRFLGNWHRDKQFSQAAQGTLTYTDQAGAAFEFEFQGDSVTWVFTRAFNRGKARVLLDGKETAVVDLYAPQTEWQQRQTFRAAGPGRHLLRVEVLGERNPAAAGTHVDVDLLEAGAGHPR